MIRDYANIHFLLQTSPGAPADIFASYRSLSYALSREIPAETTRIKFSQLKGTLA